MTTNTILILFQRHGLDPLPGPLRRIARWYVTLDDLLSRAPEEGDALVDYVMGAGLRTPVFMLEGLYRLYADTYPDPIEDLLESLKLLEDLLGHVDHTETMHQASVRQGFPAEVTAALDEDRHAARRALVGELREGRWVSGDGSPPKAVACHLETLLRVGWHDAERDRREVVKALARCCREVAREEFDLDDLEKGIHELRRELRWFPIMLTALREVAVLVDDDPDDLPVSEYGALLEHPIAKSPFAVLPTEGWTEERPQRAMVAPIEDPVRISRTLFLANTLAIAELGDLKDQGQVIEALTAAVQRAGVEESRYAAEHQVLERLGLPEDTLPTLLSKGKAIATELAERKLLKRLRKQLRKQV